MTIKTAAFAMLAAGLLAGSAARSADKPRDCFYGDGSDEAVAALTVNKSIDGAGTVHRSFTWQLPRAKDAGAEAPGLMTFEYEAAGKGFAAPTGLLNVSTSDFARAWDVGFLAFPDAAVKLAVVKRGDAGFAIDSTALDSATVAKILAAAGPGKIIRATILAADGTAIGSAAFDAAQPPALSGPRAQALMTAMQATDCSRKIDAFKAAGSR
jgi:hypothetical protein